MKILSDSNVSQLQESTVTPVEKQLSDQESKVNTLAFLSYPAKGIEKLLNSVVDKSIQVKNQKEAKTKWTRLAKAVKGIFRAPSLDKKIVENIYGVASRAISYATFSDSIGVKEVAKQLHELRLSHPAEFKTALPDLKARDVTLICNSLVAFGNIWDAADALKDGNPEVAELKINRAVKHLVNCGVPADDPFMKKFHDNYLLKAQALRTVASAA